MYKSQDSTAGPEHCAQAKPPSPDVKSLPIVAAKVLQDLTTSNKPQ